MKIVRRHRRTILFVLSLLALMAMTWSFLGRIGVDPLSSLRGQSEQAAP